MAGCLSMIAGALLGLFLGAWGCAAGMFLAGGGNSHNDLFTWAGAAVLGAIVGGLAALPLARRVVAILERGRAARLHGAMTPPFPRAFVLYLLGAAVAVFSSGTLFYYSNAIAELPPDAGGPRSDIPGEIRARVSLIASLLGAAAAPVLFVKALGSAPLRPKPDGERHASRGAGPRIERPG